MLGVVDFKVIDIDPVEIAKSLQNFVSRGSKLTGVSLDDINLGVLSMPADPKKVLLSDLLSAGMKLFDAMVWLTAGRPTSHPLVVDLSLTAATVPSMHSIARSVFYVYFFLLTQARYPAVRNEASPPKVANFLTQILGMTRPQYEYVEEICSFTPQKFDPAWVRNVQFQNLGQETLSRFGLGVAGYRLFGPFKTHRPTKDVPAELKNAYEFACLLSKSSATWDIHPVTRNPSVLTKRGNLNKNLGNLILEIFSNEQIDEMVACKILFKKPEKEPNYRDYLTWESSDDISGSSMIFRST